MGCWNATCMVSNLPILAGSPVICQVIAAAPFADPMEAGRNSTYPHDRFQPVGYAFEAKYDDYGYIDDIQQDAYTQDTLNYLRDKLIEREQGQNPYHDQAVSRSALTWASLGEWLHGGRLLLRNGIAAAYAQYPAQRPVGMAMIHKPVYEAMASYKNYWGFRDVEAEIKQALTPKALTPKGGSQLAEMVELQELLMRDKLRRYTEGREMNSPLGLGIIEETAQRLAKMYNFEASMTYARRQWIPASGAGSQSAEWEIFRLIAEASQGIMQKREEELDEDEDDE